MQSHAGGLAGAVVTQRREWLAVAQQSLRRLDVEGGMRSALQHVAAQAALAKEGLDRADMPVLARVARGHDRERLGGGPESIGVEAPGGDEGRQLERLGR